MENRYSVHFDVLEGRTAHFYGVLTASVGTSAAILVTDVIWRSAATSYGPVAALKDTMNHCDYQVTRINLSLATQQQKVSH